MSVYKECSAALRRLLEGTDEFRDTRIEANGGDVFTEIDVVIEAHKGSWTQKQEVEAQKRANLLLASNYRASRVVRFGPVHFNGVLDYARIAACVVYADPERGPEHWKTPNGEFPRIRHADDKIKSVGRRKASVRDDAVSWPQKPVIGTAQELREALDEANKRADELEQECGRLRSHSAESNGHRTWSREEIEQVAEELIRDRIGKAT